MTEPVVFQNFGGKAELFAAVLERATAELSRHLASIDEETDSAANVLRRLMTPGHLDRLHSRGGLGVIFAEAARRTDPQVQAALQRAHQTVAGAISRVLRRGQIEGSIRADVDSRALAWLVLSQIHARQFRRAHRASPMLENDVLDAVLESIRPAHGRRQDRPR